MYCRFELPKMMKKEEIELQFSALYYFEKSKVTFLVKKSQKENKTEYLL